MKGKQYIGFREAGFWRGSGERSQLMTIMTC